MDLNLSISYDITSSKFYDKRDDFVFIIVHFPILDSAVSRAAPYGVYISQVIHFARATNHVSDFNNQNKILIANPIKQWYRYHKLRTAVFKLYRRYSELMFKYNIGKQEEGLLEPAFDSDLVHKFGKIIGKTYFSEQLKKIVTCYKKIGYNKDILRQTACMVLIQLLLINCFSL